MKENLIVKEKGMGLVFIQILGTKFFNSKFILLVEMFLLGTFIMEFEKVMEFILIRKEVDIMENLRMENQMVIFFICKFLISRSWNLCV